MADDDKDAQNDSGTSDDAGGTNDTSGDNQSASGAAGGGNGGADNDASGDKANTVTREEFDALFRRMQAADKRASDAEAKVKAAEDKDKTELERATGRVQELEGQLAAAQKLVDEMALKNAFLTDNKHTWHDPADALALLDREGVEVKEGNVTGLGPAIEKLAKAKPHLLKSADAGDKGNGSGNDSSGASGSANNGRRKGDGKDDKRDYTSRFPALRGR